MDDKRKISSAAIASKGHVICVQDGFTVIVTKRRKLQIIDTKTGKKVLNIDIGKTQCMIDIFNIIDLWSNQHTVG